MATSGESNAANGAQSRARQKCPARPTLGEADEEADPVERHHELAGFLALHEIQHERRSQQRREEAGLAGEAADAREIEDLVEIRIGLCGRVSPEHLRHFIGAKLHRKTVVRVVRDELHDGEQHVNAHPEVQVVDLARVRVHQITHADRNGDDTCSRHRAADQAGRHGDGERQRPAAHGGQCERGKARVEQRQHDVQIDRHAFHLRIEDHAGEEHIEQHRDGAGVHRALQRHRPSVESARLCDARRPLSSEPYLAVGGCRPGTHRTESTWDARQMHENNFDLPGAKCEIVLSSPLA